MRRFCLLVLGLAFAATAAATRADDAQDIAKLNLRLNESLANKQYDETVKLAERLALLDPSSAQFPGAAGFAHFKLKQYAAGLEACEKALRLAGGKEDAYFLHMAGENAYGLQDFPLARKYFEQALARGEAELRGNFSIAKQRLAALTGKTVDIEWVLRPDKAARLRRPDGSFLIPLPSSSHPFQTVDKMEVLGAAAFKPEELEGNPGLAIRFRGADPIRIQFRVTLTPYTYKDALAKYRPDAEVPAEAKRYLGKSEWIDPKSPQLLEIVKPLRRDNPVETVEQILAYLRGRLTYVPGSTFKSAEDVLEQRKAVCTGWSAAFTGLCRAAGVPARTVELMSTNESPDTVEFHANCEFYVPGGGWVPVEPQGKSVIGIPNAGQVRLSHHTLSRKWDAPTANEINPVGTLRLLIATAPKYTLVVK